MAAFDWSALAPVGILAAGIVFGVALTLRVARLVVDFVRHHDEHRHPDP